jgi:hypothetical protein
MSSRPWAAKKIRISTAVVYEKETRRYRYRAVYLQDTSGFHSLPEMMN